MSVLNENQNKITAIIPVYNGEKYLREAVLSVVRQTLPPSELILVNDGSTDNSLISIEDIKTDFPTRVVSQPNSGQSSARNHGVSISNGDFIALLDQDDRWYPNHLQTLWNLMKSDGRIGWVYSNADEIDINGNLITIGLLNDFDARHPKTRVSEMISADMFILPGASMIRRTAFEQVGGFDPRLSGYEDDDLFLRMFLAGWRNVYTDRSSLEWRIYSFSTSYTSRMVQSRKIYAKKLIERFPDDARLGRYWVHDYVAPRFFNSALGMYYKGLVNQEFDQCSEAYREMTSYTSYFDPGKRMRAKLRLMRHPPWYARVFRLKHRMPHAIRRWLP